MRPVKMDREVEEINRQLVDHFGISTDNSLPMWRVSWSSDQFEKARVTHTEAGIELLYPEVREVKKYGNWIVDRYVLEHLVAVPDVSIAELPSVKMSYEPIWTFEDKNQEFLPPLFRACKLVIDTVNAAMGKSNLRKYMEIDGEDGSKESAIRKRHNDIAQYELELFGEQSSLEGSTKTGESVAYTGPSLIGEN